MYKSSYVVMYQDEHNFTYAEREDIDGNIVQFVPGQPMTEDIADSVFYDTLAEAQAVADQLGTGYIVYVLDESEEGFHPANPTQEAFTLGISDDLRCLSIN